MNTLHPISKSQHSENQHQNTSNNKDKNINLVNNKADLIQETKRMNNETTSKSSTPNKVNAYSAPDHPTSTKLVSNESIQLTLRFYDLQDKSKNAPIKNPKNVLFKVKMNTKIASLIKKVAEMNNLNADDLHFYHSLRPKNNKFLIASKTIAEENLKENDIILIKRKMVLNIRFITQNHLKKAKFDQNFSIVNDSIRLKVEENENIHSIFRLLMVNLKIGIESKKESNIANYNFYHVIFQPAKILINQINDINAGLFDMNIMSDSVVFVECSDDFFNTFIEKSGGNSTILIADLRNKLQLLEKQLSNDSQLQKENEELKKTLHNKAITINSLHSERKNLNSELVSKNNQLKELESLRAAEFVKLTKVATAFDDLDKQYVKVSNSNSDLAAKIESMKLLHGKEINSITIEKEKTERKLVDTEKLFRNYATDLYNDQSAYLTNLNERLDDIIHLSKLDFAKFAKNKYLSDEINLDPVDFDYLTLIINESKVNSEFASVASSGNPKNSKTENHRDVLRPKPEFETSSGNPTNSKTENHRDVLRPKPELEKLDNNQPLFEIFNVLYENDPEIKGLSTKEISQIIKKPVQEISNTIQNYLHAIEAKNPKIHYNLLKRWDTTKKLSTYKYNKLVSWNSVNQNNYVTDKFSTSNNSGKPEYLEANKLYKLNEISRINAIKDLGYENIFADKCNKIADIMTKINNEVVNAFDNISKNLINVLKVLKNVYLSENNFLMEKKSLIEKFRMELEKANEKVRFVQTYDKRLLALQSEIDELRSEKINFENDNSIYEKFFNDNLLEDHNNYQSITNIFSGKYNPANEQPPQKKRKTSIGINNVLENRLMVIHPNNEFDTSNMVPDKSHLDQPTKSNNPALNEALSEFNDPNKTNAIEYVDIQIVLYYDPRVDPLFLRAKKQAKLKKILKSYKKKLIDGITGGDVLSKEEVNSIVFTLHGSIDINYNSTLEELNITNHQIINAIIPK